MSGPRRLNLSGAQVIASVLATLTAAVAASYLGVAGTLVGAAVGSVVSTMGTEVYKHYLQRSEERLRSAGQVLYHSAARTRTGNTMAGAEGATAGGRHAAQPGTAGPDGRTRDLADAETAVWDHRQYGIPRDPDETQVVRGVGTQWAGATNGGTTGHDATTANGSRNGASSNGGGRPGDSAGEHAHGSITPEGASGDASGRGSLWGAVTSFFGGLTRRQWLTYGSMAGAFFLIVVAAITVFQLTTGRPVGTVVYGHHGSGPSPASPQQKATTHPTSRSSATPTGSASTSPTPSAGSSSPTPSLSVTPSSPSTVPSATPSTGTGGAARSTATPTP